MKQDYTKLLKRELIQKLEESEGRVARQGNTIKRLEREKRSEENKLKGANQTIVALRADIKKLQKQNADLKAKSGQDSKKVIEHYQEDSSKLRKHIDELLAISHDFMSGIKSVANLSDNAFKNKIEEIKRG